MTTLREKQIGKSYYKSNNIAYILFCFSGVILTYFPAKLDFSSLRIIKGCSTDRQLAIIEVRHLLIRFCRQTKS